MTAKDLDARSAPERFLQSLVRSRMMRLLRSDPNDMWAHVEHARRESASVGMSLHEMYFLYRTVLERKPRAVLELGSGISSIVLGFAALRLSGEGTPCVVHTYEESELFADDLARIVPDSILSCTYFHVQKPTTTPMVGTPWAGVHFPDKEPVPYDLVIVDGPQYESSGVVDGEERRLFDSDVLDVLEWSRDELLVLIDSRKQTCEALGELAPFGTMRKVRVGPRIASLRSVYGVIGRTPLRSVFPFAFTAWQVPASSQRHRG